MKIAWFTPFNDACGPGFMSKAVVTQLKNYFDVKVFYQWHSELQPYDIKDIPVEVISNELDLEKIAKDFDVIFYNIGNNETNHYAILNALKKQPGVVILHDHVLQHILVHDIFNRKRDENIYYWLLAYLYGLDGVVVSQESYNSIRKGISGAWDYASVSKYPLSEVIAKLGAACIVHSKFHETKLREIYSGPILRSRNPADLKKIPSQEVIESFYRVRSRSQMPVLFVCFGHMSPNKYIDRVIRAFYASTILRSTAKLVICGEASKDYQDYLHRLCTLLNIDQYIEFRGKVTDSELYSLQVESDVFVNLRNPNTEGQSGSLIEQLAAGKPVLCFNTGCFQDLPDDVAYKIEDPNNFEELISVMERAAVNPDERREIGLRGRVHALEYDSARYAKEIFEFVYENRQYIKDFQNRKLESIFDNGAVEQSLFLSHIKGLEDAQKAWGVIDQVIAADSDTAFNMLNKESQIGYLKFINVRNRPLIECLTSLLDRNSSNDLKYHKSVLGNSLYSINLTPLSNVKFWEYVESVSDEEFVSICYRKLLCREPDRGGARQYLKYLQAGDMSKRELIKVHLMSDELKERFSLDYKQTPLSNLLEWCEEPTTP